MFNIYHFLLTNVFVQMDLFAQFNVCIDLLFLQNKTFFKTLVCVVSPFDNLFREIVGYALKLSKHCGRR